MVRYDTTHTDHKENFQRGQFDEWWLFWEPPVYSVVPHHSKKKSVKQKRRSLSFGLCLLDHLQSGSEKPRATKKHPWKDFREASASYADLSQWCFLWSKVGSWMICGGVPCQMKSIFKMLSFWSWLKKLTALLMIGLVINCYLQYAFFVVTSNPNLCHRSRAALS